MELTTLSPCKEIKEFLEVTLKDKLQMEVDAFIRRNVCPDKKAEEIITNNTVALLGLVKSALIRNERAVDVWAMQDYQIFNSDKQFQGTAGMYIFFRKPEFDCDFIFEGISSGMFNPLSRLDKMEWERNMIDTMNRGKNYYQAEKDYFSSTTFVITMVFESLDKKDLSEYEKLKLKETHYSLCSANYQFYILPKDSNLSLSVYGEIQLVKWKNL